MFELADMYKRSNNSIKTCRIVIFCQGKEQTTFPDFTLECHCENVVKCRNGCEKNDN